MNKLRDYSRPICRSSEVFVHCRTTVCAVRDCGTTIGAAPPPRFFDRPRPYTMKHVYRYFLFPPNTGYDVFNNVIRWHWASWTAGYPACIRDPASIRSFKIQRWKKFCSYELMTLLYGMSCNNIYLHNFLSLYHLGLLEVRLIRTSKMSKKLVNYQLNAGQNLF